MPDEYPVLTFGSDAEWEAWLRENHDRCTGVWLRIARVGAAERTVTHLEALDVALCHGWIDGQRKGLDATHFLQKFTHRRPRSQWSRVNTENVARLIAAGRMTEAGMAEVEAARRDGRWEAAYASSSSAEVPDDLQRALDAAPQARASFEGLDGRNRYAILYRIATARRPQTRQARIQRFVTMLAEGGRLHP